MEAPNKFSSRHAGESRHPEIFLKPLDSGFRRNDEYRIVVLVQGFPGADGTHNNKRPFA
jgi:hypothetical protein